MLDLQDTVEKLSREITGVQAILLMETSGIVVASTPGPDRQMRV